METSILLAKIIGFVLLFFAIIWIVSPKAFESAIRKLIESPKAFTATGIVQLVFGLLIILIHNKWIMNWQGVVTMFGYFLAIQGIVRLSFPREVKAYYMDALNGSKLASIGMLIVIGSFFAYHGFANG